MGGTAIDSNALTTLFTLGYSGLGVVAIILVVLMFSCYVKVATVLGIVRIGIGFQSLPGAFVTGGLALAVSLLVMYPTIRDSASSLEQSFRENGIADQDARRAKALEAGFDRWKQFVVKHVHPEETERFAILAQKLDSAQSASNPGAANRAAALNPSANSQPVPQPGPQPGTAVSANTSGVSPDGIKAYRDGWRVLAPAFIVSELKDAFTTGLTIFLPFLLIDLLVATILVGVGYTEISPIVIALPLKLLLFTLVDGWSVITSNLIATYVS